MAASKQGKPDAQARLTEKSEKFQSTANLVSGALHTHFDSLPEEDAQKAKAELRDAILPRLT